MVRSFYNKKGFILYIVCALAIGLFILITGLSKFKSGAVLQLSKSVTQEKMIVVAQAAINESLAKIKNEINKKDTDIGKSLYDYWKNYKEPGTIYQKSLSKSELKASSKMAKDFLGAKNDVSTIITISTTEKIIDNPQNPSVISYTGLVTITGKVSCDNLKNAVSITETHDLKITDLSFPFLDKYALFVKSFCGNINDNESNLVIEGVSGANGDKKIYSFVYLGNRNYPKCDEYPNGSKGDKIPPILLDLNFLTDYRLLGQSEPKKLSFDLKSAESKELSKDNFFMVPNKISFNDKFASALNTGNYRTKYAKTKEIMATYIGLYESCLKVYTGYPSMATTVVNDYMNCGQDITQSGVFKQLLDELFPLWTYYYGYTDYNHICPELNNGFGLMPPFHGLAPYFEEMGKKNAFKMIGGSMPALFGADRKTPVYVDGPVYVRFFKVGLIDESTVSFNTSGSSQGLPVDFPSIGCVWENRKDSENTTFSGDDVGRIDAMTHQLMSHPVDWLSINNFYFGSKENVQRTNKVSGGPEGYDVFHYLDPELRTVSTYYDTVDDFFKERIKEVNKQKILDLDGISVIYGKDQKNLDFDIEEISKYQGKGMIISAAGNCVFGNELLPSDGPNDYLKIWLMGGRFYTKEGLSESTIQASLISTVEQQDNSSAEMNAEGGFFTNGTTTNIIGNLIIDDLFDMTDKKNFVITHDPKIYSDDYPVRVSVGAPKKYYMIDYQGKD